MMGLPEAAPNLFAWYAPGFSDALGDRLLLFDNTEDRPLELLRLCPAIAGAADAESLLRARTQAFATLDDDRFARVCRVDRLPQPGGGLAIVSEHVEGQRLSEFLTLVHQRGGRVGADLTISVVSKLVIALGVMHRRGAELAHGALGPERLVVAPGGRVIVTESVLSPVLEGLPFDRAGLWHRLRVALPPGPGPTVLDQQVDLFQVAFVAIAMVFGRLLRADEDPARSRALLDEGAGRAREAGWDAARWLDFERWLLRALQLSAEGPFADTIEAGLALASLSSQGATALGSGVLCLQEDATAAEPDTASVAERKHITPDRETVAGRKQIRPDPETVAERRQNRPDPGERRALSSPALDSVRRSRRKRRQVFAAALALALGVPGVYLGARALWRSPQAAPPSPVAGTPKPAMPDEAPALVPARLDVRSDPPGARVFVDGQPRGVTPVDLNGLPHGEHRVRLESDGRSITQAVMLEPARTATLFVPFRGAGATSAGWLTITSPVELTVYEDGDLVGTSRSGRIMLPSGQHILSLVNESIGLHATREVQVPFGKTVALEVGLPDGRADINAAPWAEVWIDGEKAGDTPLANFPMAPGRHTVTFRHPRLGERSVDCFVTLREPLRLSADLTK